MNRLRSLVLCVGITILAAGCPKAHTDYNLGKKAESVQDFDAAFEYYLKALKSEPYNANYKIKLNQARFEAGQAHVKKAQKLREAGDLQGAVSEIQRAQVIDPSSPIVDQELRRLLELIAEKSRAADAAAEPEVDPNQPALASMPPELKPLSQAPINLNMTNDAKIVFDTIAKLAGLTVIYDPEFPARRVSANLSNLTLQQALDIVALESKAVWKPVTENIIFVYPDQAQKRRENEEQVVRTFYLSNTVQPQDLTEIVTGLRQLLDLKRIQQVNGQNAIVVRDTPDKLLLAEKVIRDIDKAKPEVIIQVEVLQARTDRLRDLGILPGQRASLTFAPSAATTTAGSGTTPPATLPLNRLRHLSTKDYNITLPGAAASAVLTDTYTKIIQNPEIRAIDGQPAKLRVGDRVPIATGSFQAGVGVGTSSINPLVNTQFTYQDVGVNVDITPRVHPNREISMKVMIEVSSVTGHSLIGGIDQPIISQRKIEHDIRLKEGEVNILGGLIERTDTKSINGWPGLAKIPFMRYFFSEDNTDHQENEVLIVLTPRIVRMPDWTKANLRPLYSGSETNIQVRRDVDVRTPGATPPSATQNPKMPQTPPAGTAPQVPGAPTAPRLHFEPQTLNLKPGQTAVVGIVVDNVTDLFSIPLLVQYNPAVVSIEEVQHGGFLSGGTQEIAIVQRVDKEHGQAIISATRQPNTPGVNGTGTLLGLVIKGIAPGNSNLTIVQVNAKDSQQKAIPLMTGEATLQVQP
ncbi:MAG TPA: hypothetical protein VN982_04085 [Candidatus Dormibacteraeota bacterium]|nr:hypothetical protein [Candidatus Dormibacteraeota bacterium]